MQKMTLKRHHNHYNIKLLRGYGVSINIKQNKIILKKSTHDITGKQEKVPPLTQCPVCGDKFVVIYHDGIHPVVPPDKMYEGLVDGEDWHVVKTENYSTSIDFRS